MSFDVLPSALRALLDEYAFAPAQTCSSCGVTFRGGPESPVCWDCEHRTEAERDAMRRAAEQLVRFVPEAYRGRGFDAYLCPPGDGTSLRRVATWSPGRHLGLYLCSRNTGTGKTHLAYARIQAAIYRGRTVYASSVIALVDRLKATFRSDARESEAAIFAEVLMADVLMLDDLGANNSTEWGAEVLFRVIDGRVNAQRMLLVTSNFGLGELANRIGGEHGRRIVSRLAGACEVVQVVCGDYRARKRDSEVA